MTTFGKMLSSEHGPIEAIMFSDCGDLTKDPRWSSVPLLRPMSMEDATPYLDIEFDSGFGGQDCLNMLAWTPNDVFFINEYDGSVCLRGVPRNPPSGGGIGGLINGN